MSNICVNPECKKIYDLTNKEADMDCCSFACWEKVNCLEPPRVTVENIEIGILA